MSWQDEVFQYSMNWRHGDIERNADQTLDAWMAFEAPFDDCSRPWTTHLVGWCRENKEWQVSSPVAEIDAFVKRAVTRSGIVYELVGWPSYKGGASATWKTWKNRNEVSEERDFSYDLIKLFEVFG